MHMVRTFQKHSSLWSADFICGQRIAFENGDLGGEREVCDDADS